MVDLVHERPLLARAAASTLFVLVLATFLLPFLSATTDERVAAGTGVELARGDASLEGRYVHAAFEGQVEAIIDDARGPAFLALVAVAAGALLTWLPARTGATLGLVAALVGLAALFALYQAASSAFADTEWRFGYWLALLGLVAAAAWTGALAAWGRWWWRPPRDEGRRDYFAPPASGEG